MDKNYSMLFAVMVVSCKEDRSGRLFRISCIILKDRHTLFLQVSSTGRTIKTLFNRKLNTFIKVSYLDLQMGKLKK